MLGDEGYDIRMIPTAIAARPGSTVVLSRPLDETGVQIVSWLQSTGHRVIVDMDDDFDHLPTSHGAYGMVDTSYIHAACQLADLVTVTTPALAQIYGHGHHVVIPNAVPEAYFGAQRTVEHEEAWIGWYGSRRSHPIDPQVSRGAIGRALVETDSVFSFVGAKTESSWVRQAFRLHTKIVLGGWYLLNHLADAIVHFDVGVVPLAPVMFNDSKSWLKASEMAAVGVPVVMSPTPANRELHQLGVGVLAEHPNEWYRQVTQLITDTDHRAYVASQGRHAMAKLTYEQQAGRWYEMWCPDTLR